MSGEFNAGITDKEILDLTSGMTARHTKEEDMARAKIAISLDEHTLDRLDQLVRARIFPNRGQAIQEAGEEKLSRIDHNRLARECAKLDPAFEKALAEKGLSEESGERKEWVI